MIAQTKFPVTSMGQPYVACNMRFDLQNITFQHLFSTGVRPQGSVGGLLLDQCKIIHPEYVCLRYVLRDGLSWPDPIRLCKTSALVVSIGDQLSKRLNLSPQINLVTT